MPKKAQGLDIDAERLNSLLRLETYVHAAKRRERGMRTDSHVPHMDTKPPLR